MSKLLVIFHTMEILKYFLKISFNLRLAESINAEATSRRTDCYTAEPTTTLVKPIDPHLEALVHTYCSEDQRELLSHTRRWPHEKETSWNPNHLPLPQGWLQVGSDQHTLEYLPPALDCAGCWNYSLRTCVLSLTPFHWSHKTRHWHLALQTLECHVSSSQDSSVCV